jgi:hypothetical protein
MLIKNVVICKSSEQTVDSLLVNVVDLNQSDNNVDIEKTYDDLTAAQKVIWDDFFNMATSLT